MTDEARSWEPKEAVALLFEADEVDDTRVTGFLALFAGSLGALWTHDDAALLQSRIWAIALTIMLGLISLGLYGRGHP